MKKDFRNYAVHHLGMNGLALDQVIKAVVVNNIVDPVGFYLIKINYALNTGVAFGLNDGNSKNISITILIRMMFHLHSNFQEHIK